VKTKEHDEAGIDLERTQWASGSDGMALDIDGFSRSQNSGDSLREYRRKCDLEWWNVDFPWGMSGYAALTRPT